LHTTLTRRACRRKKRDARRSNDRAATHRNLGAGAAELGPEDRKLEVFIGKWINEGETVAAPDAPGWSIVTSDLYEWIPGRFG
jgi:hypothetical protein